MYDDPALQLISPATRDQSEPPKRDDPLIGRTLGGRYAIFASLAEGGMASVYRARDANVGDRVVAVKILSSIQATSEDLRSRFLQEMRILADLRLPGVVSIHDFGVEADGLHFIVMDLVAGRTLLNHLYHEGSVPTVSDWEGRQIRKGLPLGDACSLIRKIAEIVGRLHQAGVLHRDLKPGNVMVVGTGAKATPTLLDLGLAKTSLCSIPQASSELALRSANPTVLGQPVGTLSYMPPEQLKGELVTAADHGIDVYALACMFYELLCGFPPHDDHQSVRGVTDVARSYAALYGLRCIARLPYASAPSAVRPDVPPWVDKFLTNALNSERNDRYLTIDAFIGALDRALAGIDDASPTLPPPGPEIRPPGPWHFALVGIALIVLSTAIMVVRRARRMSVAARPPPAAALVRTAPSLADVPPGSAADASIVRERPTAPAVAVPAPVPAAPTRAVRRRRPRHDRGCGTLDPVTGTLIVCPRSSPR